MPFTTAVTVAPARRVSGRLRVPGDKSISHRYALLAALANGPSRLTNFAPGADCRSTVRCLRALGVVIDQTAADELIVHGRGLLQFQPPQTALDAGNSGTTMRMLAGVLAAQAFTARIVGDESLSRRPMRRVIAPLAQMGAVIEAVDGHPPLTIRGASLRGIEYRPEIPSAQVKSAILLAGLHAGGRTSVIEPAQTRDHTERALAALGFKIAVDGLTVSVAGDGRQSGVGGPLPIPGDFSSAAFWMAAAAALPGSRIEIEDLGLNPTRTALIDVLRRFGANVQVQETGAAAGEPRGTVVVEAGTARAIEIDPSEVPALIDELPAVAALAARDGEVTVRGAEELRVKESDRIAVLVAGFRGLGIAAEERPDGFTIRGGGQPAGGTADAAGDHRMAMAFAVAGLAARAPSRIEGSDSVVISYPGFFEALEQLVR